MQGSFLLEKHPARRALFLLLPVLALFLPLQAAAQSDKELWWGDAEQQAAKGHYELVDYAPLAEMLASNEPPLLVDTRTDYEYAEGHIPGAVHLEFDMSDSLQLSGEKRTRLIELLGPDKKRLVVFYCRSFR